MLLITLIFIITLFIKNAKYLLMFLVKYDKIKLLQKVVNF